MHAWKISFQYWDILFVEEKIATLPDFCVEDYLSPDALILNDDNLDTCLTMLCNGHNVLVVCLQTMRRVVDYFMTHYRYVRAAGGIVESPHGNRLLIYRNERWDLPKGKVEEGETIRQGAVREVMEETGMHDISMGSLAIKTYHIFNLYGGWHLKQTSWFYMQVEEEYPIVVQEEEGITAGEWVSREVWKEKMKQSYATMRGLAEK